MPITILIDAFKTSLLVGFVLNAINYGPSIADGGDISWPGALCNFVIPFCVAAYSGARAARIACPDPEESLTAKLSSASFEEESTLSMKS